jgi:hypothetical protein
MHPTDIVAATTSSATRRARRARLDPLDRAGSPAASRLAADDGFTESPARGRASSDT